MAITVKTATEKQFVASLKRLQKAAQDKSQESTMIRLHRSCADLVDDVAKLAEFNVVFTGVDPEKAEVLGGTEELCLLVEADVK